MENKQASLVEALCRHREVLRRETTFLRREVTSRNLSTMAGKRAYLQQTQLSNGEPQLQDQEIMDSKTETTKHHVSLPYLVSRRKEALGLLLHETDLLRYRIQSLASILREFPIIVASEKKAKMLHLMSETFVAVAQHIIKSCASASPKGYYQHYNCWESTWGSQTRPSYSFFDDTSNKTS
jgi:hypothetical protein